MSNVSFSLEEIILSEKPCTRVLYHAIKAGLDMAIVNSGQITIYEQIPLDLRESIEDVLFNRSDDVTDKLIDLSKSILKTRQKRRGLQRNGEKIRRKS